ncbi:MAG: hypothetical protein ACREVK_02445 [Gammaproteobacteria bacterium]
MSAPVENPGGEVHVYQAADGEVRVDVRLMIRKEATPSFGSERGEACW